MALDVKVTINLAKPVGRVGSWFPLLFVEGEAEKYAEYKSVDEVLAGGYTAESDAYKAANLIFMQDNAPEKIAILTGTEEALTETLAKYSNKGWRQLMLLGEFNQAVAEYVEGKGKMYFAHFATQEALTAAYAKIKEFDNTVCVLYTDDTVAYPEAAVIGATAGLNAGSFTYKNMLIKGVPALDMSDTEIEAVHANDGITIVEKAGDTVTSEGIVASGEYADVIDSKDSIIQKIAYYSQKVFNNNKKVPYTNNGIAMLEAATLQALVEGYNDGMIAENDDGSPAYSTTFALRSGTTEADRASRNYPYGKFAFSLSGAIHKAEITGEITV